ncbi:MAG: sodium:solute symporter [Pseudomonadota bacterium]
MSVALRARPANPRLGTYFGILLSTFVTLVVLLMMFEQLGVSTGLLRLAMSTLPLLLFIAIGAASFANEPRDYFASGRRVPAFFNGLVSGFAALGGVGIIVMSGLYFVVGYDAQFLLMGWCAGFVMMVVLIVPYLRKAGAYTLAGYLSRRFESRGLRILTAALLLPAVMLLLAAEMRLGAFVGSWLTGQSEATAALAMVSVVIGCVVFGGMRSLTWSSSAKALVALLALLIPVTVVALWVTNLPLPQFSYGPTLRGLGRQEWALGFPNVEAARFAFDLPGLGFHGMTKRFAEPFASVGMGSFLLATFAIMAGVAASPVLLSRTGTSPGVYEARKSIGWAVVMLGFTVITVSAVAVFFRDFVMQDLVGIEREKAPAWFMALVKLGLAQMDGQAERLAVSSLGFKRDAVLFALPIAAGMPAVVTHLALLGGFAACTIAAAAAAHTISVIVCEDIIFGTRKAPVTSKPMRLNVARASLAIAVALGGWAGLMLGADPLDLFLWSLALSGSVAFPILILSIWWKRLNKIGAGAGMAAGFSAAVLTMLAGEAGFIGLDSRLAGVVGIPVCLVTAMAVSALGARPSLTQLEYLREIRVPGGETVYDREMRLLRLRQKRRGAEPSG